MSQNDEEIKSEEVNLEKQTNQNLETEKEIKTSENNVNLEEKQNNINNETNPNITSSQNNNQQENNNYDYEKNKKVIWLDFGNYYACSMYDICTSWNKWTFAK